MPNLCPACGRGLVVSELRCRGCQATLKGEFPPGPLARLDREQQQFMLVFVRNRGNLREVERELGSLLSDRAGAPRPTGIRAQSRTGAGADAKIGRQRQEILAALERGEITAEEAVARLKPKRGRDIARDIRGCRRTKEAAEWVVGSVSGFSCWSSDLACSSCRSGDTPGIGAVIGR